MAAHCERPAPWRVVSLDFADMRGRPYPPSDRAAVYYLPGSPKRVILSAVRGAERASYSLSVASARALMVALIQAVDEAEAHKGCAGPVPRSTRKFDKSRGVLKRRQITPAKPSRLRRVECAAINLATALRVRGDAAQVERAVCDLMDALNSTKGKPHEPAL